METVNQVEIKDKGRDIKTGRFTKGNSGNPTGNNGWKDLRKLVEALENESLRQGFKNFDEVVARRALQYKEVLIAVMKKVYPEQLPQPIINVYTQIWNSVKEKARDVEDNGRVHIGNPTEVQA